MTKVIFPFLTLALIGVVLQLALSSQSMRPPEVESGPNLTLLISGEELGYLEPCGCAEGQLGGFPRRDSVIQQLTVKGKTLLPVANGDLIDNASRQSELKAEIGFAALKEMGYAAYNVGERDLLLGIDRLKYLQDMSGIPFLSANLFHGENRVFEPFVFHTVNLQGNQIQVAIIGILSQSFEIQVENAGADLRLADPNAVLIDLVEKLDQATDLIVLLAHANFAESEGLAAAFPQIDVVVSGHEIEELHKDPVRIKKTVLLNTGTKGKAIGQLDIRWSDDRAAPDYEFQALSLSERLPDSPRMIGLLKLYQQMLTAENLSEDIEREPPATGGMYVGSASCKGCHAEAYALWKKSKHAHAYETLVSHGHAADPECLMCHTVGFGFQSGFVSMETTPNLPDVGCENCHGVGGNHVKNPQKGYGQVTKADCLTCHTMPNSPKFDYGVYLPRIRHWSDDERQSRTTGGF